MALDNAHSKSSGIVAIGDYLTTDDHSQISRLTIGLSSVFAIVIAACGSLFAIEKVSSTTFLLSDERLNQMSSVFRIGLIFAVIAPLMLGIALAVIPSQIGAQTLAFTRSALCGVYLWLFGVVVVGYSYLNDGGLGGQDQRMVDLFLLGMALIVFGLLLISSSLATTLLSSRGVGVKLFDMPIFSWSILVTSVSWLLTLPVLGGALIYVAVDHTYESNSFGGAKAISTWIGWVFGAPQIFVLAIPVLGLLGQVVITMTQAKQQTHRSLVVGVGLIAAALISSVTHTTYDFKSDGSVGQASTSVVPFLVVNLLSIIGALIVFGFCLKTIKTEKAKLTGAFVPAFLGVALVMLGMIGNWTQRITEFGIINVEFGEAVLIYVGYGSLLGGLGAVAHFGSQIWGHGISDRTVIGFGIIGFLGIGLAALGQFLAGFAGNVLAESGEIVYPGQEWFWHSTSAVGHIVVLAVCTSMVATVVMNWRRVSR